MAKTPQTLFGKRMRQAREQVGLPQDKLGVLIGIDEGSSSARISRYETGEHEPSFEIANKLAKVLNVPTAFLYCQDDLVAELLLVIHKQPRQKIQQLLQSLNQ